MDAADSPDADGPDPDDDQPAAYPGHPAAYAVNWKQVLLTDAGVGLAMVTVGVAIGLAWVWFAGAAVAAFGCTYLVMVGKRFTVWRGLRRDAGLPT
jgi:hypothetical protein